MLASEGKAAYKSSMTFWGRAVLACSLFVGVAQAGLIVSPYAPPFNGTTNLNDVTLTFSTAPSPALPSQISVGDVRGTAAVIETLTSTVDLIFSGSPAVPNTLLLAVNGGLSQEVLLSFNLIPADLVFKPGFYTGDVLVVTSGIPVGTVTDPSLTPFLGNSLFDFTYEPNLSAPSQGSLTYGLSAIAISGDTTVPEPSALPLVATACLPLFIFIFLRQRKPAIN